MAPQPIRKVRLHRNDSRVYFPDVLEVIYMDYSFEEISQTIQPRRWRACMRLIGGWDIGRTEYGQEYRVPAGQYPDWNPANTFIVRRP